MRKKSLRLLLLLMVLALLPFGTPAQGEELPTPSPTPVPTAAPVVNHDFTIEPTLGYDGLLLLGRWMPTFLTITNHGDDFVGSVGVNVFRQETVYDRYEMPLELAKGATKRLILPIRALMNQDMYAFEIVRDGKIIAEQRVQPARVAPAETLTVGLLSKDPKTLNYMEIRPNGQDTLRGERWLTLPLSLETFPETISLMQGFSILVVDDIDARTLSDAQQLTLTEWLKGGGIVILSGGAKAQTSYPFFERFSGLVPGSLKEAEDITPTLLSHVTMKGKAAEASIWLSELDESDALVVSGEGDGLLAMSRVDSGLLFSCAFDLAGKPLASWSSMSALWPRLLRQEVPTFYSNLLMRLDNMAYNNDSWITSNVVDSLEIENDESGVLIFAILLAYLAVIGFGGYLLLRRLDRREWLWGLIPAASVLFGLVFFLMSQTAVMNKPVALTAARLYMSDDENTQIITHMGVATQERGELTVSTDVALMPTVVSVNDYYYYSDSQQKTIYRPLTLNQRFRYGDVPSIGYAQNEAWQQRLLVVPATYQSIGGIDARVWVEEDGIHGEVTNKTDALFTDCLIVSRIGYAIIDKLLPGQRAQIEILTPEKAIDYAAENIVLSPGVLYGTLNADTSNISSTTYMYYDVYSFINAAYQDPKTHMYAEGGSLKRSLITLFENEFPFYENNANFYFFGFNDTLGKVSVTLSGTPVERQSHAAVAGKQIAFEPIGPTGLVYYPEGMISLEVLIDQGEDSLPRVPTADDIADANNNGYSTSHLELNNAVAARFSLPNFEKYTITKMTLAATAWDTYPSFYIYNHKAGEWEEQKLLTVSMSGDKWAPYIDGKGDIYIRYVPSSLNRYSGMSMPTITLRGEVK